jgi:hypothetical protein
MLLFDSGSQCNLVSETLVDELGLETYDLVQPSSLVWLQGKIVMRITQRCKIKFSISVSYVDEVECEVAPLDAYGVMFGSPYLWDRDATFYRRENKVPLGQGWQGILRQSTSRERERITPLAAKQGQTSKKQATFVNNGMVDMERQMEALCFHLLNGPTFGDQNPSNGEV